MRRKRGVENGPGCAACTKFRCRSMVEARLRPNAIFSTPATEIELHRLCLRNSGPKPKKRDGNQQKSAGSKEMRSRAEYKRCSAAESLSSASNSGAKRSARKPMSKRAIKPAKMKKERGGNCRPSPSIWAPAYAPRRRTAPSRSNCQYGRYSGTPRLESGEGAHGNDRASLHSEGRAHCAGRQHTVGVDQGTVRRKKY